MFKNHIHPADLPLFSSDLSVCQKVFDAVRNDVGIKPETPENDLLAAQIITFYKQGLRDEERLTLLARVAATT